MNWPTLAAPPAHLLRHAALAACASVLTCANVLAADPARDEPAPGAPRESGAVQHTFALNPVFIPFGTVTAEYERALLTRYTSAGMSAWYEYKDVHARWLYAKAMVYPFGNALHGLGVGLTAGIVRGYREPGDVATLTQDTAPIVGLMAQYNLLFGPRDLGLVGVGIGGRTTLKGNLDHSPLQRYDGEVRLVAGVAF